MIYSVLTIRDLFPKKLEKDFNYQRYRTIFLLVPMLTYSRNQLNHFMIKNYNLNIPGISEINDWYC